MDETLMKETGQSVSLLIMSGVVMGAWVGLGLLAIHLLG
jgi:hypothetical protein